MSTTTGGEEHPSHEGKCMEHERAEWSTHFLTDQERDTILRLAATTGSDPYDDLGSFVRESAATWDSLTAETRNRVAELASGTSARPELCIANLPEIQGLPPTPAVTDSWARLTRDRVSESIMITFATGLGFPISYLDQRDGSVFHDVYPTRSNATAISSQSSSIDLGLHTEMFFHPEPPDFLALHCLRSPRERSAYTSVASLTDIEARLSEEDRATLREPLFALDLARLHGRYTNRGRAHTEADARPRIPIITDSTIGPRFRFEPALMTPTTDGAAQATRRAEHTAEAVAAPGVLREQSLLIVDNRRAAHSRSPFVARFDGSDRWLRRMMIGRANAAPAGAIERHDLELVRAWCDAGTIIEPIPYGSSTKEQTG
jgi:hypothetical protein